MSAVIFCAFAAVLKTRRAVRYVCIFAAWSCLVCKALAALLEAVEVVTTGATFTTAATIYAACCLKKKPIKTRTVQTRG